jgi:hypothetical protein
MATRKGDGPLTGSDGAAAGQMKIEWTIIEGTLVISLS